MTAANPLLPKPREMWVEMLSGDFEPRKQELERLLTEGAEAEEAEREKTTGRRFGQQSRLAELRAENERLAEEYDALMAEAREHGIVKVLVRSVGRTWRQLKDEHLPRPDNEGDEFAGFNRSSFFEEAVKPCIVEPKFADDQWDEFVEQVSDANWQKVCNAAWHVNENTVDIPKSSAVSLLRQTRGDDSKSAESTESTPQPTTDSPPSSDTSTTTQKAS